MILKPAPVPSSKFTWDSKSKTYVAEMSDLGKGFQFDRVFDDAVDVGLTLMGEKMDVVFTVDAVEVKDGDILFWTLVPASLSLRPVASMTIFND